MILERCNNNRRSVLVLHQVRASSSTWFSFYSVFYKGCSKERLEESVSGRGENMSSRGRKLWSTSSSSSLSSSSSSSSASASALSWIILLSVLFVRLDHVAGCQFYPIGEYLKFVRVPENLREGSEILSLEAHPRNRLTIIPVDKEEDSRFFSYKDVNGTHVSVTLAHSLEDLVDAESPRNLLKFRVICDYTDGRDTLVSSHLSVTVYVEDINDHAPEFIDAPYHVTVDELTSTGVTIFRGIHAVDGDKPNTPNSDIHYAIVKGNEQGKFSLESGHRTALILRKPLDYDNGDREYTLVITATDRGVPAKSNKTTVRITVLDNDDLDPKFTQDVYKTKIYEYYPMPDRPIFTEINFTTPIHAIDRDHEINVSIRYDIISGNEGGYFHLDPRNGTLYLKRPIDLENERNLPDNTFALQIHATQIDNPLKMAMARVEIEILDLNDNLPEFEVDLYNISIVENLPNGFSVLQVIAHDKDQGLNGEFDFRLDDPSGAFSIDPKTGWLTVKDQNVLDRERRDRLRMKVYAMERKPSVVLFNGERSNGSSVDIHVSLLDANDNNPIFVPSNLYELVGRANAKIGTVLGQVHAIDDDLGTNGLVKYTLQKPGNSSKRVPPFVVDENTGVITVAETPIIEGRHAIFVEAADQPANPSERRFSLAVVTVDVFRPDGPDTWEPDFVGAPYEFWVGANVPVGTSVGQIRINDAVKTSDLIYDLLHSYQEGVPFAVEERSGTITVVDEIERYERSTYEFEGVVTDERDITLITNVSIHVVDPNDEKGALTKGATMAPIVFHVKENVPGTYIGSVLSDNGTASTSSTTSFLIVNQQDVPDISITKDGDLYAPNGFDRETRQNYSITVIVEGSKGLRVVQIRVIVDDENDHPPVFTSSYYEGRILENSPYGTEVVMVNPIGASDKDEGINQEFIYSLTGEGCSLFKIDPRNARVFFEGSKGESLNREERAIYDLEVVAEDGGGLRSTARLKIIVEDTNDNPPKFIRMIVLPDQGVKVSNQPDEESNANTNQMIDSTTINGRNDTKRSNERKSPLLLVPENVTIGTPIIRLLAEDKDEGINSEISYNIQNETISGVNSSIIGQSKQDSNGRRYFLLDSRTAEISIARSLPPERNVRLIVFAKDGGGLTDNITIRIHVVDVNDHPPVFDQSWYTFDLAEGIYMAHTIGTVRAIDNDFGVNANVNYEIISGAMDESNENDDNSTWIFDVGPRDGVLRINGKLDREKKPVHRLILLAHDDGSPVLSSTVEIEVNVLDVNDNAPNFYNYDELENDDRGIPIPVYRTSIFENSPIGTFVTRIHANDSDFAGNGNGLILFNLVNSSHEEKQYFTIDSKEGSITTISNLDYEKIKNHRLIITASDLGSPISMTSTAVVTVEIINIDDGDDNEDNDNVDDDNDDEGKEKDDQDESFNEVQKIPTFRHRYYEVEVEENTVPPIWIAELDLADGYQSDHIRYSIVADGTDARDHFSIDSRNGSLYLITNVDREMRDRYEAKVRVDRVKLGRGMPVMIYPVVGERLNGLAPNEARVVVRIKDTNDNAPRFKSKGRPILAAIPTTAHYGYEVIKVEADDPDDGINGEIRYQILGREDAPRFAIDPLSGQVRSVASFTRDAGRVFGFDVKATDRRGSENGRSGIANVFVYVLDDQKQVVMVVGQKPIDIEPHLDNFTAVLHNITGLDVRVRKLEPHIEKNLIDATSTDVYLYAIDPHLNVMIDMDTLHNVFHNKKMDIKRELDEYHVLEIAGNAPRRNHRYMLSTLEVGVVVLGCVVFVGALITAICVTCVRRNKRRRRREKAMFSSGGPLGFALADSTLQKPPLFPTFVDGLRYDPEPFCTDMTRRQSICDHGPGCVRFHTMGGSNGKHGVRTTGNTKGLEASATSLHSSGQDSGIVARASCHCSHSSSPSSGESSNGYEDSLKSLQRRERSNDLSRGSHDTSSVVGRRANQALTRRRQRFNSFTNLESMYSHEMTLQRDQRCCVTEKRRKNADGRGHEHRRAHSEAENNITETVIHEHPGMELPLASSLPNASSLHSATRTSHMLY
ncbi:cadherin-89D isoform X2 [Vespa velutina]|uniref:cadherin-89D isoform X2 n=1 Tax=Vespa velutina TaxID=202808 RepID=UPI001FB252B0|nr:cadherin-89D isoform X2 [Vespa velutina]